MPVKLVFIHGWGFDASFWDPLCALLPRFPQRRVDLGFFGAPKKAQPGPDEVLIGHSLGFMHGLMGSEHWRGWIAINGFMRFVEDGPQDGCVKPAALREMRMRLQADTDKCLRGFCRQVGAQPAGGKADKDRLREGLDELRHGDAGTAPALRGISGLVLAARNDPLVPETASMALGAFARRGGPLWHATGGHILPQSVPEWCAAAIASFITSSFA